MATQETFTGDGSTTTFAIPFETVTPDDIKVSLDGVDQTLTTHYTLETDNTQVEFVTAPANGVVVRIYRETDTEALSATFFIGSSLRAKDLNDNFKQTLFAVQEVKERSVDSGSASFTNDVDLGSFRIVNLADGTGDNDAVNKSQLDASQTYNDAQLADTLSDAQAAASTASSARTAAETAQAAAEDAQTAAEEAITEIEGFADAAEQSAQDAADAAQQAATFTSDPIFYGFSRNNQTSELVATWSTATEPDVVYVPTNFEYKGDKQWFIGTNGLLSTAGANLGQPNFSFNANGHLIVDLD
jgi:hypothetical protein